MKFGHKLHEIFLLFSEGFEFEYEERYDMDRDIQIQ